MDSPQNPLNGTPHGAYWLALEESPQAAAAINVISRKVVRQNAAFRRFAASPVAQVSEALSELWRVLANVVEGGGSEWTLAAESPAGPLVVKGWPLDHQAGLWLICVPDAVFEPTRDEVTGVADRRTLMADLQRRSAGAAPFAVLFVDLNGFKQVNDQLGHIAGDSALREVADRIEGCLRDCDLVGRFGGDEFVVLLDGVSCEMELAPVAGRIQRAVAAPLTSIPDDFALSASVGWSLSDDGLASAAEMLSAADSHMYANKQAMT